MGSSMSCSIKGLRYLAKSPRVSGVPIASSTVSLLFIWIFSIWFTLLLYCPVLEHGSEKHRRMTLDHLLDGLLEFATNEQGSKSLTKALKEGGLDTLDKVVRRMCESAKRWISPVGNIELLALTLRIPVLVVLWLSIWPFPWQAVNSLLAFCLLWVFVRDLDPFTDLFAGWQGPACVALRMYPGSYRYSPRLQDRL